MKLSLSLVAVIIVGFCLGSWSLNYYWTQAEALSKENLVLEYRVERIQVNLKLVQIQLETERTVREAAEVALSDLRKVVSDEEYNQQVPASIQQVLDDFRNSVSPASGL